MAKISTSENIDNVQLTEQGSAPATPGSGYGRIYCKSDGLYFIGDDGIEIGPLGEAGESAPAESACDFYVDLSSDITGLASDTATKIAFNNEVRDTGSKFDIATNHSWTPPAGIVDIHAQVSYSQCADGDTLGIRLFKNGSLLRRAYIAIGGTRGGGQFEVSCSVRDAADGDDYYQVYALVNVASGTRTIKSQQTYFHGTLLKF